jgi:hypothetical protein
MAIIDRLLAVRDTIMSQNRIAMDATAYGKRGILDSSSGNLTALVTRVSSRQPWYIS